MTESRNAQAAADAADDFLSLDELQARQDAKLAALGRRRRSARCRACGRSC
ncbi:hypothetical protein [Variovorax paradoxus]|uniref:hypothetical protein n=1 Tax=Variovorax paradoxus TaxID=34073 RepID=UPI001ABC4802